MAPPVTPTTPALFEFNNKKLSYEYRLKYQRFSTQQTIGLPIALFNGRRPK
jgi:hypothetical protein